MADSVINGAIGKSPMIDKMNQLAVNEAKNKTTDQMVQHVCGQGGVRYPSSPISFRGCGKAMEELMVECRKGKERSDVAF